MCAGLYVGEYGILKEMNGKEKEVDEPSAKSILIETTPVHSTLDAVPLCKPLIGNLEMPIT